MYLVYILYLTKKYIFQTCALEKHFAPFALMPLLENNSEQAAS